MGEVVKLLPILNGLETLLNHPRTTLGSLFAMDASADAAGATVALQPDEFVHLPALDAAKKYLRMAGKPARPFNEIVEAIKTHGGEVGREDRLRIQLVRSTSDIKKVGEDHFGLTIWYPARKGRPVGSANRPAGAEDDVQGDVVEEEIAEPVGDEAQGAGDETQGAETENGSPVSG